MKKKGNRNHKNTSFFLLFTRIFKVSLLFCTNCAPLHRMHIEYVCRSQRVYNGCVFLKTLAELHPTQQLNNSKSILVTRKIVPSVSTKGQFLKSILLLALLDLPKCVVCAYAMCKQKQHRKRSTIIEDFLSISALVSVCLLRCSLRYTLPVYLLSYYFCSTRFSTRLLVQGSGV